MDRCTAEREQGSVHLPMGVRKDSGSPSAESGVIEDSVAVVWERERRRASGCGCRARGRTDAEAGYCVLCRWPVAGINCPPASQQPARPGSRRLAVGGWRTADGGKVCIVVRCVCGKCGMYEGSREGRQRY